MEPRTPPTTGPGEALELEEMAVGEEESPEVPAPAVALRSEVVEVVLKVVSEEVVLPPPFRIVKAAAEEDEDEEEEEDDGDETSL
jgi:hypothetical protein